MKEFDYIRAWHDIPRPAYDTLPADVRQLFLDTATIAAELRQAPDCSMIWPTEDEAPGFRPRFDKIPAEWLAFGARVIHYLGHWNPGAEDRLPEAELPEDARAALKTGAHWKFSLYADQSLRKRFGYAEGRNHTTYPNGAAHLEIHEGVFRVCYSSRDSWTWAEVAPATTRGKEQAEKVKEGLFSSIGQFPENQRAKRDQAAYEFIEACRTPTATRANFLDHWAPWTPSVADRYMVERGQMGLPSLIYAKATKRMETKIREYPEKYEAKIRNFEKRHRTELEGRLWWLTRGIDDENLIYYDHTGVFSFGWREPLSWETTRTILELVSEFPFPYQLKVAPCSNYPKGTTLEGGIQ